MRSRWFAQPAAQRKIDYEEENLRFKDCKQGGDFALDGVLGVRFVEACVRSHKAGGVWMDV